MFQKIAYRDGITGALRTEHARVVKVTDREVVLRSACGLKYGRPLDLVETIAGKPVD